MKKSEIRGRAKDGVYILRQPVTRPQNITFAQAKAAVRKYRLALAQGK